MSLRLILALTAIFVSTNFCHAQCYPMYSPMFWAPPPMPLVIYVVPRPAPAVAMATSPAAVQQAAVRPAAVSPSPRRGTPPVPSAPRPAEFAVPQPAVPPTNEPKETPRIEIVPTDAAEPERPANPLVIPLGPTETKPEAPKSAPETGLTIPTITPKSKPETPGSNLPALQLPTSPSGSASFASPLATRPLRIDVFPVANNEHAPSRTLGIFNYTDRSLSMTIDDRDYDLPAGHCVNVAAAGPRVAWKIGTEKQQETTIPSSAAGLEIVVRP